MTIWVSRELPLFNFERVDILCTWIWPPSEKLWPFEILESFRCSILSISTYYASESDLRVTSYDHFNFSRASVIQFRPSQYIMRPNGTSIEKFWPFEFLESFRCSISSVPINYAPESDIRVKSYEYLNFTRASVVQFRTSRYIMRLNLTSEWKVMSIWNSRELSLFNFEVLYMWCPKSVILVKSYDHMNFSRAFVVQFRTSWYIMRLNWTSEWKVMTIWISRELSLFNFERLDILCAWMGPPLKRYDNFNFSKASVVQLCASRYIMRQNRTSEWKVMTIWNSRELTLFNFEHLDILCAWIGPPSENYDHLNFSRASVVEFRASRYIIRLNRTSELKVMTIWISQVLPLFNFVRLDILCA